MSDIKLASIQVGKIQTHLLPDGAEWTSAYVKTPVSGAVFVGTLTIEGDDQRNKRVHGGEHRVVLSYSAEHYPRWKADLGCDLGYGSFAENFTVFGLDEDTVCLGDIYQIGDTVRLEVSQPRQPCDQIYTRLGIEGIREKVDETRRTGWYSRTLQTGYVEAGMAILLLERPYPQWTIRRAHEVMDNRRYQPEEALELAAVEALAPGWRKNLAKIGQS